MIDNNCPLCKLCQGDIKTYLHYQDAKIIIVDCLTHRDTPMVVLKDHRSEPTEEEIIDIMIICNRLFPDRRFRNAGMTSIKGHFHEHLIL